MSHYFKKRTNHFPFYQKPHSFRWFTEPKRTRKYLNFKLKVDKKVVFVVFIYEVISEFSEFIYEVISNWEKGSSFFLKLYSAFSFELLFISVVYKCCL